jgi:hypothetical protein
MEHTVASEKEVKKYGQMRTTQLEFYATHVLWEM